VLQIAAMTYAEVQAEDFAHAYQLKNILRELAMAMGTGLAALQLQAEEAVARMSLLDRLDALSLQQWGRVGSACLARLSAQVTQQAVLIACDHALLALALLAGLAMVIALWQETCADARPECKTPRGGLSVQNQGRIGPVRRVRVSSLTKRWCQTAAAAWKMASHSSRLPSAS
jgi:hypothetical protein